LRSGLADSSLVQQGAIRCPPSRSAPQRRQLRTFECRGPLVVPIPCSIVITYDVKSPHHQILGEGHVLPATNVGAAQSAITNSLVTSSEPGFGQCLTSACASRRGPSTRGYKSMTGAGQEKVWIPTPRYPFIL
jgi:hypothetical protein